MKRRGTLCLLTVLCLTVLLTALPVKAAATVGKWSRNGLTVEEAIPFNINPRYESLHDIADLKSTFDSQKLNGAVAQSSTVHKTIEDAGMQVREHMKAREETFTVQLWTKYAPDRAILEQLMEVALEHTGDPKEGDYLAWQYAGWQGTIRKNYTYNGYNNTITFQVVYYTTAEQEAAMDTAVAQVLQELNAGQKSDDQKISAVYDYICQNVAYDYENLEKEDYLLKHTAYAALMNKTAVCQGYALLMYRLLLELGVDNRLVVGISDGENHAWNIAKIGSLYYNLDATWDAGGSKYTYFLRCRENFENHIRYLEYESFDFHNKYPMSVSDYQKGASAKADSVIASGTCGNDVYWMLNTDRSLTITGSGVIDDYPYGGPLESLAPWRYWSDDITKLTVGKGISGIGCYNFCDMSKLESVSLPNTLTQIGMSAFSYASRLQEITIPGSVTVIGDSVFHDCTALTSITIPDSVTMIGSSCFSGCTALKNVSLSANLTQIPGQLFYECCSLERITLPGGIRVIEEKAFHGCGSLVSITIPAGVSSVDAGAFQWCSGLETVIFEGSPTLGMDLFDYGNGALKKVWFKGDAPVFHVRAFSGVTATCYYPKNNATWTEDVIQDYCGTLTWVASCEDHHTEVVDAAVAPTCTESGLTEGTHCSVCGEVITAQKVIPPNGHKEVSDKGKAATCTEEGLTDGTHCSVCGQTITEPKVIPAAGHQEAVDQGKEATCTEDGLTEGKHCTVCGAVTVAQQVVPATGKHSYEQWVQISAPTLEKTGLAERKCKSCGKTEQKVLEKLQSPETEPSATNPLPTEPAPTDPAPTEPVPTEPAPTDPAPTEPVPTEPAPTEPIPTEPIPTEPIPTEPVTTDPVPPVQSEPVQTQESTEAQKPAVTTDPGNRDTQEEGGPGIMLVIIGVLAVGAVAVVAMVKRKK